MADVVPARELPPDGGSDPYAAQRLRARMVDALVAAATVRDAAIEQAMRTVPRHTFLPGVPLEWAYRDEAVPIRWSLLGEMLSSASQPSMIAIMLAQLALRQGQRVLEVGTGSGYNAALLAYLVGRAGSVTSVDIDAGLVAAARVHLAAAGVAGVALRCADGSTDVPAGPFDRIVVTAAVASVPSGWRERLVDGGRLVVPVGERGQQWSTAYVRVGERLVAVSRVACAFVPLRHGAGEEAPE